MTAKSARWMAFTQSFGQPENLFGRFYSPYMSASSVDATATVEQNADVANLTHDLRKCKSCLFEKDILFIYITYQNLKAKKYIFHNTVFYNQYCNHLHDAHVEM